MHGPVKWQEYNGYTHNNQDIVNAPSKQAKWAEENLRQNESITESNLCFVTHPIELAFNPAATLIYDETCTLS